MEISFFVPGVPASGGSKKSFMNPKTKRIVTIDDCKRNAPWRNQVSLFAKQAYDGPLLDDVVSISVVFVMPRPKSHYGTGKKSSVLKPGVPVIHTKKPDGSKLFRALEDALTGVVWTDDSRVGVQKVLKIYGVQPGALVSISDTIPNEDLDMALRLGNRVQWNDI